MDRFIKKKNITKKLLEKFSSQKEINDLFDFPAFPAAIWVNIYFTQVAISAHNMFERTSSFLNFSEQQKSRFLRARNSFIKGGQGKWEGGGGVNMMYVQDVNTQRELG